MSLKETVIYQMAGYVFFCVHVSFYSIILLFFFNHSGGRIIRVTGQNLDVVQEPKMRVTLSPPDTLPPRRRKRSISRRNEGALHKRHDHHGPLKRWRRIVPEVDCPKGTLCQVKQVRLCDNSEINQDMFNYIYSV